MSNQNDFFKIHYANETLNSTTFGMSHGPNKADYIDRIHVRNGTHTFFARICLTSAADGPGDYDFSSGKVTGYFLILNNNTGEKDRGGPITGGTLRLDYYDPTNLGAMGKTNNLTGDNLEPFKNLGFSLNAPFTV